ncbi:hypothetical protein ACSCB1_00120 [Streptomyces europaeiscabiei]|uniref:hypothetical protein n=1 Tax=Streptomyces europaeiscabiei TaxID=146819 RepID=UPI00131B1435
METAGSRIPRRLRTPRLAGSAQLASDCALLGRPDEWISGGRARNGGGGMQPVEELGGGEPAGGEAAEATQSRSTQRAMA